MKSAKAQRYLILAAFVILCAAYFAFAGSARDIHDLSGDASGYMLAAQHFAPFVPSNAVLQSYNSQIIYPPLFPMLIGALGGTYPVARVVVVGSVIGVMVFLNLWLRAEGFSRIAAAGTTLIFALMPVSYVTALNIWTENTYTLLSMIAIFCVTRAQSASSTPPNAAPATLRFWWWAAAAVALASLTRVAALPLLVAFLAFLAMKRPRAYVWYAIAATLPFCLWLVAAKTRQVGLEGYTSQWSEWYNADLPGRLAATMQSWLAVLPSRWREGFVGDVGGTPLPMMANAIGLLALAGWLDRLYQRKFDAVYFLVYIGMLLVWPHPEEALRYGFVLCPLMIAYPLLLLIRVRLSAGSAVRFIPSPAAWIMILIAMTLPSLMTNVQRYRQELPAEFSALRHMDSWYSDDGLTSQYLSRFHLLAIRHMKTIGTHVAATECVFSVKSHVTALHSGRIGLALPDNTAPRDDFERALRKCRYAYVINLQFSRRPPMYPLGRLGDRAVIISSQEMTGGYGQHLVGALIEILPPKQAAAISQHVE